LTPIKLYDLHHSGGQPRYQPVPLTHYRPVCQQSWSQGLLLLTVLPYWQP